MDGVRYNGNLIYFNNEWYGIDKKSRLYTCTAARVGYIIAKLFALVAGILSKHLDLKPRFISFLIPDINHLLGVKGN